MRMLSNTIIKLTQPMGPWHVLPVFVLTAIAAVVARPEMVTTEVEWAASRWVFGAFLMGMSAFCAGFYLLMGFMAGRPMRILPAFERIVVAVFRRVGRAFSVWAFFCRCFILAAMEAFAIMLILTFLAPRQLGNYPLAIATPLLAAIHLTAQLITNTPSLTAPTIIEEP